MNKFVFNKNIEYVKTSASNDDRIFVNKKQREYQKAESEARKKRKSVEKRRTQAEEFNDAPFAIQFGDNDYHPINNPTAEPKRYEFIHKDLPKYSGENERGGDYARELKQDLMRSGEYKMIRIPRSQYSQHENADKLLELAPHGMIGFRRRAKGENISTATDKLLRANAQGRKQRARGVGAETESLDPDSVANTIATHKGDAIDHLMSMALGTGPYKRGGSLCVCGGDSENGCEVPHGPKGKEPEQLPQMVHGTTPGYKERLLQNPLLKAYREVDNGKGQKSVELAHAFDEGGPEGTYMPMIHFTPGGDHVKRYTRYETLKAGQQTVGDWETTTHEEHPSCACGDGKINSNQNDNIVGCRCCFKGNVNMKESTDSAGNPILVPHTIGLGGGKQKYVNPEDAPLCKICKGDKFTEDGAKSTPCVACNATGHDTSAISCDNCHSDDSSIALTPDNVCPHCDGTLIDKTVDGPKVIKKKKPPTHGYADDFYGNAEINMPLSGTGVGNTGVDHYSHLRRDDCKNCEHDDQEMFDKDGKPTNLPCPCHIRSAADPNTLPPGTRIIHGARTKGGKPGFYLPKRHVQAVFANQYGGLGTADNPHSFDHFPNYIDPSTGQTTMETYKGKLGSSVEDMKSDAPLDQRLVSGMMKNGIDIPEERMNQIVRQSEQHWKAPNAHYTAPSKDLALVKEVSKEFGTFPDLLPPYMSNKVERKMRAAQPTFQHDPEAFPEHMREGVSSVEKTVNSLPDASTGRYNQTKDELYKHISHGNMEEATKASNKLAEQIERFSGPAAKETFKQSVSKFPTHQTDSWSISPAKVEEPANE